MSFANHIGRLGRAGYLAIVTACLAMGGGCAQPTLNSAPNIALGGPNDVYRLAVGDKIRLGVFDEPNLSGEFDVGAGGQLALPLIGQVPAQGRSLEELRRDLTAKFANGYLKNPKVTVEMLNYRPVFVHGEVKNGGQYTYTTGLRLRDAVAMAGGYTYRADQSYVHLSRGGHPLTQVAATSDFQLLPGDNIRIPERFF